MLLLKISTEKTKIKSFIKRRKMEKKNRSFNRIDNNPRWRNITSKPTKLRFRQNSKISQLGLEMKTQNQDFSKEKIRFFFYHSRQNFIVLIFEESLDYEFWVLHWFFTLTHCSSLSVSLAGWFTRRRRSSLSTKNCVVAIQCKYKDFLGHFKQLGYS